MNDITLCTMHTEKPYYIKEINKNIYSIEELSYYLFNYLYLIDDQFFSEGLIDYIENELKQPHIASGIRQINANKGALGEKISFLIKNAGYYTEREAEKLENHLVMLSSKTAAEILICLKDFMVMFITILVWLTQDCLNTTRLQQLLDVLTGLMLRQSLWNQ